MRNSIYIPPSSRTAEKHLRAFLTLRPTGVSKKGFMKAYCSFAYLYPGFHPDGIEDWEGPSDILAVARDAWRRARAGELTDNELYPYQASKAAISQGRNDSPSQRQVAVTTRKR